MIKRIIVGGLSFPLFLFIFPFFLSSSKVHALYDFGLTSNVYLCYNSRTFVGQNQGYDCYSGNWRFRYQVANLTDEEVPDYFNTSILCTQTLAWSGICIEASVAPGTTVDINRTVNGTLCVFDWGAYLTNVDDNLENNGNNLQDNLIYQGACDNNSTPTPTVVSCSPSVISQTSYSGSGTPLVNNYNSTQYKDSPQYTLFTAAKTGKLTKAEIYGSLDRDVAKGNKVLQCKVTSEDGSTTLGQSIINNGPFTKGNSWMNVDFTTSINLTKNATYRLYCKVNNVAGGGYIYWLDFWNNRTDKTRKAYTCD